MNQSRLESFIEALVNTAVGFAVTMVALPVVNKMIGIEMSIGQASASTAMFTAISIARGYVIRRFFNDLYWIKNRIKQIMKPWGKSEI